MAHPFPSVLVGLFGTWLPFSWFVLSEYSLPPSVIIIALHFFHELCSWFPFFSFELFKVTPPPPRWTPELSKCLKVLVTVMSDFLQPHRLYPPGSSVYGMLQASIMEWVAMLSSRGSSQPRDRTWVSCIAGGFFTIWAMREALSRLTLFSQQLLCFAYMISAHEH